ncbi:MAG: histidine kinase dimerization/phospho-acceptor domain-containing protein, partial [Devosia sp.]
MAATLGFAASLATSFYNLRKYESVGQIELTDSTWIVAQTKIDFHRLLDALALYAYGDESVDMDALSGRLDAYWSRLPLYLEGEEGARFSRITGLWDLVRRSLATLEAIEPEFRALERGDMETYRELRRRLILLDRPLNDVITNIFVNSEGSAAFRNERLDRVHIELLVALIGTFITGGVFIGLLLMEGRRSRRAEGAAELARTRLAEAIDAISEGFVLTDKDDHVLLLNRRFGEIFGHEATAAAVGRPFGELMRAVADRAVPSGQDRESWVENQVVRQREPAGPYELPLSDGRWVRVSDRRTATGAIVGIRTDITELKHREIALIAARNEAEGANQAKTQFLATKSHELRTPLNAIIGFSDLMCNQRMGPIGSPRYQEYAQAIQESGQHLLAIITDILDIARIEAGRLELEESDVDLSEILESCLRVVHERADEKGIAITVSIDPNVPEVRADQRLLKQTIFNLLGNSIKFTPQGGRVTAGVCLTPDGRVGITVSDTGIGIAEADLPRVLQPFVQLE